MSDIKIRRASINDLEKIINLNKLLFELEYKNYDSTLNVDWPKSQSGRRYFTDAINNNITFVALNENNIVGYLVGSLNTELEYNKVRQAELDNMCILDEYRKNGIGTMLFDEFKKVCIENEINEIKVTASYDNKNAINFYKKNGFKESEIILKQKI